VRGGRGHTWPMKCVLFVHYYMVKGYGSHLYLLSVFKRLRWVKPSLVDPASSPLSQISQFHLLFRIYLWILVKTEVPEY
jgi:hypothetical protein